MPAYVLVDIDVHDPARYARYKELAEKTVTDFGGRYLVRGGPTEALEGDWRPRRLVVLEFPSMESARAWWASPEYAAAKALRLETARSTMLLADGL